MGITVFFRAQKAFRHWVGVAAPRSTGCTALRWKTLEMLESVIAHNVVSSFPLVFIYSVIRDRLCIHDV